MKKSTFVTALLVALSLAVVPACKKKKAEDKPATEDTTGAAKPADMPASDPAAATPTPPPSDPAATPPPADPAAAGATDPAAAGGAAGATDPAAAGATDPAAAGAGGATEVKKDEEKKDEPAKKTGEGGW